MLAKGLVRVIEVVLFSFILFTIILPNLLPEIPIDRNRWEEVVAYTICNDLLSSMALNRTLEDVLIPENSLEYAEDKELLENLTTDIFPPMMDFDYEVKGVPAYNISVGIKSGCNIPNEVFKPNYPPLNFSITTLNATSLLSNSSFDVYILCGNIDLSSYEVEVKNLLNKGKGLVLFRNFTTPPDSLTEQLFQIVYEGGGGISKQNITFNNLSNPNTGRIAKRFVNNIIRINTTGGSGNLNLRDGSYVVNNTGSCINITGCHSCLYEGDSCILDLSNITIYQIDSGGNWFDVKLSSNGVNPRNYLFIDNVFLRVNASNSTILSPSSIGKSLANARVLEDYTTFYETQPRVFWIYDFNLTRDDLKLLLKTAIIWASGEHHFIFGKDMPKTSSYCIHYYSGVRDNNIPFLVKLNYWGY